MSRGSLAISLGVAPDVVWPFLVAPGRHDWYYRLTPHGDFVLGAHIRWLDGRGELAEESEVVELKAPRRLVMRSRFMFGPTFAAAHAHVVSWELTGDQAGSEVSMSWDADGPALRMLESEAGAQLRGLRLAADPSARLELERLPEIGDVEIRDVTPDRVADYQRFFDHEAFRDYPAWQSCYCMETQHTEGDAAWAERTAGDNRRDMTDLIQRGRVTALLAYAGGKPVGWCNYGETTRLAGLAQRLKLDPAEHEGIGSIGCFAIAAPYRGHRLASMLLDAAIERLRERGLSAVEVYPSKTEHSAQGNYRGPLEMYVRAGFLPYRELERYVVLRKVLA